MSVIQMAQVWKHSQARKGARLVILAIADIADDEGFAHPRYDTSLAKIGRKCLMSMRAVRNAIRHLEGVDQVINGVAFAGLRPPELATRPVVGHANAFQVLVRGQRPLFAPPGPDEGDDEGEGQVVDKSPGEGGGGGTYLPEGGGKLRHGPRQVLAASPSVHQGTSKERGGPGFAPPVDNRVEEFRRAGMDPYREFAKFHGWLPYLQLHFEHFCDYVGEPRILKKYKSLERAFRNAMRADWGHVRASAQREARLGGNARAPVPLAADRWPPCRYCGENSVSIHEGIPHCAAEPCTRSAMDRVPAPKEAA